MEAVYNTRDCCVGAHSMPKRLAIRTCTLVINNSEKFSVRYARTCMGAAAGFGGLIGGEPLTMSLRMALLAGCAKIGASRKLSFALTLTAHSLLSYCGFPTTHERTRFIFHKLAAKDAMT